MKSSKLSLLYVQVRGIVRFQGHQRVNPNKFTQDELHDFLVFKTSVEKERHRKYYQDKKKSGKLVPRNLSQEQLLKKRASARRTAAKMRMRKRHLKLSEKEISSAVYMYRQDINKIC